MIAWWMDTAHVTELIEGIGPMEPKHPILGNLVQLTALNMKPSLCLAHCSVSLDLASVLPVCVSLL
jgi:hypothetical protein